MVPTLCLFTCALAVAQPADRSEWLLTPRLVRGQELVYHGTFREEVVGQGSQFVRSYRLEASAFVLAQTARGLDVAFLTVLEQRALRPEGGAAGPQSVRLELARVDGQGRVVGAGGKALLPPIEGPPTVECGAFVEVPGSRIGLGHSWEVGEPGRPPRLWRLAAAEEVNGTRCLRLVGEQKSDDWARPRADRGAWRRLDTVWLSPGLGVACRVERVIERKEPARKVVTQRSVLRYDLLSRMTYPGRLCADRQAQIWQARRFYDQAAPLLSRPGQYESQIDALRQRIASYLQLQPPIEPYGKAILHVQRRLEAARRGEAAPDPEPEEAEASALVAARGKPAPDFVASNLTGSGSLRLHRLLGRPVVLAFYSPSSPTAREVLRFANGLRALGVTALGMSVSDDAEAVRKQHAELGLNFPVLAGAAFKVSYGVEATPRLVILDGRGIVRASYTGWGTGTGREVVEELRNWLP